MMRDKFANQASTSTNIVSGFALDFISDQKAFTITLILHNNDLFFEKGFTPNRNRFLPGTRSSPGRKSRTGRGTTPRLLKTLAETN